ncbi:hypothetical protein TcasGA2_TC003030 [Tribolium castaneum]|uniref:Uncharacterized protein n=1 Tax=Tribolium castaneum TaxID=7070 RepID=D6WG48_TRICA|nr:hypothetical protein TcasGA2_TC003030 [Tribolium castaneum]
MSEVKVVDSAADVNELVQSCQDDRRDALPVYSWPWKELFDEELKLRETRNRNSNFNRIT